MQSSAPLNSNSPLEPQPSRQRWIVRRSLRWLEHTLAMVGATTLLYLACFDLSVMTSGSMSPTLEGTSIDNGDWVLAEKVTYWFRTPRRWEILRYEDKEYHHVMKRVVGLPGETIAIPREGELQIDGQPATPPTTLTGLKYYPHGDVRGGAAIPCNAGYFVLGDDSRDSDDSRFNGPIAADKICARAWLIVWPWKRIGLVNP